jgi:hypothetical protein
MRARRHAQAGDVGAATLTIDNDEHLRIAQAWFDASAGAPSGEIKNSLVRMLGGLALPLTSAGYWTCVASAAAHKYSQV